MTAAVESLAERMGPMLGWWISLILIVIVSAVAAGLWFASHRP
jgi:hypothetical protein